jgi:hypothetical protein
MLTVTIAKDTEVMLDADKAAGEVSEEEFKALILDALQSEDVLNLVLSHPRFQKPVRHLKAA